MLGSPKQRDLLPGVTYDQAVGYAIEVFERIMPAIAAAGIDLCLEPLAPNDTDFLNTCAQAMDVIGEGRSPSFQAAHGREGPEQRTRHDRPRADRSICHVSPAISMPRMSTCGGPAWGTSTSARS